MSMRSVISFGLLAAIVAYVDAWPNGYDDEFEAWRLARRSFCAGSGSKCYSTGQCCKGFVCAAFDEVFESKGNGKAENPEIPGFCVKEKDLQPCSSRSDCDGGGRCASLGRGGEKYCVPKGEESEAEGDKRRFNYGKTNKGGIGSRCETDNDCKTYNTAGTEKLCCQEVRKGRTGIVRMCDPITPISRCIRKRK